MEKTTIFNVYNLLYQQNKGAVIAPPFLLPSGDTSLVCFCVIKDDMILKALFYDAETLSAKGDVSVKTNLTFDNVKIDTICYLQKFNRVLETLIVDPDNAKGIYSEYLNDFTGYRNLASFAAASYPKMITNIALFVLLNVKESKFLEEKVLLWRKRITFNYFFEKNKKDIIQHSEQKITKSNSVDTCDKTVKSPTENIEKSSKVTRADNSILEEKSIVNKTEIRMYSSASQKKASLIEQVSPELVTYNTAVSKILGRGIFRYNIFKNCKNFFLECVEKETEILSNIYKTHNRNIASSVTELPADLSILKDGQVYSVIGRDLSNAEIDVINHADVYVFADGGRENYNANIFDMSDAGLIILEKAFEKNGFELQCDFKNIASYNCDIYEISGDVLLNNTILAHFSKKDNYVLTDEDFEWIKGFKVSKEVYDKVTVTTSGNTERNCEQNNVNAIDNCEVIRDIDCDKEKPELKPQEQLDKVEKTVITEPINGSVIKNVDSRENENDIKNNNEKDIDLLSDVNTKNLDIITEVVESNKSNKIDEKNNDQQDNVSNVKKEDGDENAHKEEQSEGSAEEVEQQPNDTEIRGNNIAIKAKILKENSNLIGRLKASRNVIYEPILSAYQKAKDDNDYKFLGATYCTKNYDKTDGLFKTDGYKLIYENEKTVKQLLEKIIPVSRNVCCFGCRHHWDQDVTFDEDGYKKVKCPKCDMPVGMEV